MSDVDGDRLSALPAEPSAERRCGFIAIIGAPNAGKSTLLNRLVGAKVAIVSHKVQTTRVPVRGIAIRGEAQLVFIDTPGIFAPRRRLDRAMVDAASAAAGEADAVLLLVDAVRGVDDNTERILAQLASSAAPRILVLNKIDRMAKDGLLGLTAELNRRLPFAATFMVSATDGSGVEDLMAYLARTVPIGPWHYPADELTDATERTTAAEMTRERIYHHLHDELPYQTTVETTAFKELKDGSVRIEQTIFVERESQRSIVLGEGGRTIKIISMESRRELTKMFERPVHLFVFVKVQERWEDDPEHYREMGLDFPKE
ncbi:MAG: GTPase Era [Hyphomicrobiaceae bacterium]